MSFTACNSKDEVLTTLPSSATVRSFSLEANDSVLPNLDSVFFTIDLYTLRIFNADSLPYGTKINSLVPVVTTESASEVKITYTNDKGEEVELDYLENTTDTVNFNRPVKMLVVSYDRATEREYTININVHQVPTDTLVWSRIESGSLPTLLSAVNAQHTSMSPGGTYYCMTQYDGKYCMAFTDDPGDTWQSTIITPGFTPDINSMTATNAGVYILDTDGNVYESTDNGVNWTATGNKAQGLIGAYGSSLISTVDNASGWQICEYPSGKTMVAPAGFPVKNTSTAVTVTFEMSTSSQMIIVGGRKADGSLTNQTWGFDGESWVKISRTGLPQDMENLALVPYFDIKPDSASWRVSKPTSVLLAMCGNDTNGVPGDSVYISNNFGLTWAKAPASMQLPASIIPTRTLAQAYPYTGVSYAARKSKKHENNVFTMLDMVWKELRSHKPKFRISSPIEEWDVPYIYLFGGVGASGQAYNTVYRGVITALTFKPIE